ncbi:transporter substrate-binding domain-containing protein [Vibrio sp. S4M6]|uniref:substrate-binding periplasmic protein n=1 Tax=Vibrio sinus TaxID=2946865 RepID=UPI00202A93D3|nr:transporter substrate-binding domain-containing protein [Vibrio sinus]MCL9779982.1 transporter substrate-binding domain-containing protein [Vibrio sinus]
MFVSSMSKVILGTIIISSCLLSSANALTISTLELPPFSMRLPNGDIGGPVIEIVRDICEEMDEKCQFDLLPNKRLKHLVRTGEVDGGFPYGWNEARAEYLYYSVPLLETEYGLFISGDNDKAINGPADLQGLTLGVFGPKTNMYHRLDEVRTQMVRDGLTPFDIHASKDLTGELVKMLELHRIDGYYVNKAVGYFRANRFEAQKLKYAWKHMEIHYFVVFPKATTDVEVVRKFNQAALRVITKDGYLEKKLFPLNISPPPLTDEIFTKYDVIK